MIGRNQLRLNVVASDEKIANFMPAKWLNS